MFILFTHSKDEYCAPLVAHHLKSLGAHTIILHTDKFPFQFQAVLDFEMGKKSIIYQEKEWKKEEISGIWIRKWAGNGSFSENISSEEHQIYSEANTFLTRFVDSLSRDVFVMDSISAVQNAEDKILQLETAKEAGLSIPKTLITNHPHFINQFISDYDTVVKMQTVLSWGMEGSFDSFFTQNIDDFFSSSKAYLRHAPLIHQEKINKVKEYRVVYVDGAFFCGVIPESTARKYLDWRIPNVELTWETGKLLPKTEEKLHQFMQKLNLKYGILDILEDETGAQYFLEVNPIGEWGMLEKFANLPISKAIAKALIKNKLK